jgi:hypothetical protein
MNFIVHLSALDNLEESSASNLSVADDALNT